MGGWRSGSAAPLHGDGRGFESLIAHQPSLFELRLGKPELLFIFQSSVAAEFHFPSAPLDGVSGKGAKQNHHL
jgi:hypothetical protein